VTMKNQSRFPKELIDAAIAHSIAHTREEKKKLAKEPKVSSSIYQPPKTPSTRPDRTEMSQTKPRVGNDFEKVFSKVIGARDLPETKSVEYSETYQKAFGPAGGEKSPPPKQAKYSIKPATEAESHAKPIQQEKARNEGFSAGYAAVFGRLKRDEDAETNTKIRESLKKCVQVSEKSAPAKSVAPSKSVFEMLGRSAGKNVGSDAPKDLGLQKNEDANIAFETPPVRAGKSVFEMLANSEKDVAPSSGKTTSEDENPRIELNGTSPKRGKSVFERLSSSGSE
jgi:hypothetical protein